MAQIDSLEVQIQASAVKANQAMDSLTSKLNVLSTSLSRVNGSGLQGMANGVNKLSNAMRQMQSVKMTDYNRLVRGIEKLGTLNTANINSAANSISRLSRSFNGLGAVSNNAMQIGELAKNIAKLGYKSTSKAITNLPLLATALNDFMNTMSKAPKVSNNLIRMTDALSRLSANGSRVGSATRAMTRGFNGASSSARSASGNFNLFSRNADRAKKSSKNLGIQLGMLYAKFYVVVRAVKALGKAVGSSMDYIETYNFFDVVTNKISDEYGKEFARFGYKNAEEYAKSFKDRLNDLTSKMTGFNVDENGLLESNGKINLGLDPNAVMDFQATVASITNASGMIGESSLIASKALTMLSADMSSLRNVDLTQVMDNFKSALVGQTEAVYKYGIDLTQATLKQYAYANGIGTSITKMSQSSKMQLRLLAILDQSKVAWGDLANTINQPANQLRLLKTNFQQLARMIGNVFMPIVANILPYINGLVVGLQKLVTWIASLTGADLSKLSSSIGGANDGMTNLEDSTEDVTDNLGNAEKKAKKLKQHMLGIDELNVFDNDDSDSTSDKDNSGNVADIDLSGAISKAFSGYEKAWNEALKGMNSNAEEFAKKLGTALKPARKALEKLWNDGFKKLVNFTTGTLKDFYNNFLVPVGTWVIGTGFPRFCNITKYLLNNINWTKLQKSLSDFYTVLGKIAILVFDGILDFYEHFLSPVASWAVGNALPRLLDVLTDLADSIDWKALNGALEKLWDALSKFAIGIGDGLVKFIESLSNILKPVLNVTTKALALALEAVASAIKALPPETLTAIGGAIGGLATGILIFKGATTVATIVNGIKSAIAGLLAAISAHPYVAIALGIASLAGAILSLSNNSSKSKGIDGFRISLKKLLTESDETTEKVKQDLEDIKNSYKNAEIDGAALDALATKYMNLASKERLSNKEKKLLKSYAEKLVEKIPELKEKIDDETGAYKGTKEELQKLITKTKEYYKVQAAKDALVKLAKDEYTIQRNINNFEKERSNILKKIDKLNKSGAKTNNIDGSLTKEYRDLVDELDAVNEKLNIQRKIKKEIGDEWEYAENIISNYSGDTGSSKKNAKAAGKETGKNFVKGLKEGANSEKKNYTIGIPAKVSTTPKQLANDTKNNWNTSTANKTLPFAGLISTLPEKMAEGAKKSWDNSNVNKTLPFGGIISTPPEKMATNVKQNWEKSSTNKVLAFSGAVATTPTKIAESLKNNWNTSTANKTLPFAGLISTLPEKMASNVRNNWVNSKTDRTLDFDGKIQTEPTALFSAFNEKWGAGTQNKNLSLNTKIQTTTTELFTGINKKWKTNTKDKQLALNAKIQTAASALFTVLNQKWKASPNKTLTLGGIIGTSAVTLFNEVNKKWKSETKNKTLKLNAEIDANTKKFQSAIETAFKTAGTQIGMNTMALIISNSPQYKQYATGGFPEEGPFFMNRGEIAGSFGNGKSVVANNQQITGAFALAIEGSMYNAVYGAMMSAISSTQTNTENGNVTKVYLDSRVLLEQIDKKRKNNGFSFT